jgi:Tfp pilus assembly protein PilX
MITGLAVVGIIATTLVVLVGRERRISAAFGDRRAAARLAEATLADLRAGHQPTAGATSADGDDHGNGPVTRVEVTALADPAAGASPGRRWVQVRATVAGRTVTLVGLVPDGPGLLSASASTRPAAGSNGQKPEAP